MNCCETRDEPLSDMRWCNISTLVALLVALSVAVDVVVACGPGRGAGRRRIGRRLTPLVFKQHEPNMVENSMHASGLAEGTVTRNSTQFQDLVPIYGQDIVFRDEEGTGADRIMTQRCKEKLSTLAISVMNQWPGVKLRVTEGWEEHVTHERNSLHYEGRAVDITTSDRDRAKYGMLARLAVEAGFDWVYYESRAHIHCSVKSESSQAAKYGGCFTADTTVQTSTGAKRKLSDLHVGEHILALDPATNTLVYSEVLLFLDWDPNQTHQFIHFVLASGKTLTVTPAHLLMTVDPATNATVSLYADRLTVDSTLLVTTPGDDAQVMRDRIISVKLVLRRGIYAPLTAVGTVVVDGVVASCYATVDSVRLAHWVFAPVRLVMNMRNGVSRLWTLLHKPVASWESREKATGYVAPAAGVYWYARLLYTIGQYLIPYKMHN